MLRHRELVTTVAERIGVTVDEARAAAEAAVAMLARTVGEPHRGRLLDAMPATLREQLPDAPGPAPDADAFISGVAWLAGTSPEQARYRAQAVLATLAAQDPGLISSLDVPDDIRSLFRDPEPGGGLVGPEGRTAPLTDAELASGLAELPDWSGDRHAIRRTLVLPPENLDRVLDRVGRLHEQTGRLPDIRREDGVATFEARTTAVDAVTRLDLELARQVDAVISEAAAGIAY